MSFDEYRHDSQVGKDEVLKKAFEQCIEPEIRIRIGTAFVVVTLKDRQRFKGDRVIERLNMGLSDDAAGNFIATALRLAQNKYGNNAT